MARVLVLSPRPGELTFRPEDEVAIMSGPVDAGIARAYDYIVTHGYEYALGADVRAECPVVRLA